MQFLYTVILFSLLTVTQAGCSPHQFPWKEGDGGPQPCPTDRSTRINKWPSSLIPANTCVFLPSLYLRFLYQVYLQEGSEAYQIYLSDTPQCDVDATKSHTYYNTNPTPQCFSFSQLQIDKAQYLMFECGGSSNMTISRLTGTLDAAKAVSSTMTTISPLLTSAKVTSTNTSFKNNSSLSSRHSTTPSDNVPSGIESSTQQTADTSPSAAGNSVTPDFLQKESNRIALGLGLGLSFPAVIVAVITLWLKLRKKKP